MTRRGRDGEPVDAAGDWYADVVPIRPHIAVESGMPVASDETRAEALAEIRAQLAALRPNDDDNLSDDERRLRRAQQRAAAERRAANRPDGATA